MPITFTEGESRYVIRLEGDVDVTCAAELKRMMIEAIASRKELQVDLTSATDLDVTAVQLLWAAKREAEKVGTIGTLGPVPEHIVMALREAGLENFLMPVLPEGVPGEGDGFAGGEHK